MAISTELMPCMPPWDADRCAGTWCGNGRRGRDDRCSRKRRGYFGTHDMEAPTWGLRGRKVLSGKERRGSAASCSLHRDGWGIQQQWSPEKSIMAWNAEQVEGERWNSSSSSQFPLLLWVFTIIFLFAVELSASIFIPAQPRKEFNFQEALEE